MVEETKVRMGVKGDIEGPHARAAHRYAITWLQPTWSACACPLFVTNLGEKKKRKKRKEKKKEHRGIREKERWICPPPSFLRLLFLLLFHPLRSPTFADLRGWQSVDNTSGRTYTSSLRNFFFLLILLVFLVVFFLLYHRSLLSSLSAKFPSFLAYGYVYTRASKKRRLGYSFSAIPVSLSFCNC